MTTHQGALLKSKQYERFLVHCHKNSKFHAGYMVYPYVNGRHCSPTRGLFTIDTNKGGTDRFGRHLLEHEKRTQTVEVQQELGPVCREKLAKSAAIAVLMDLRPLTFAENNLGMEAYAKSVFEAGQSVSYGVNINPKSYLPTRTAVMSSLSKLIEVQRKNLDNYFNQNYC